MSRLLRDRYYTLRGERALDLATGESVVPTDAPDERATAHPPLASLVEVLDHGREGSPRWIVADADRVGDETMCRAAEDGRSRGFIPIAVDVYLRLVNVAVELDDRSLLLIARPGTTVDTARKALRIASARTSRPHVLLTFETSSDPHGARLYASAHVVREARAVYAPHTLRPAPNAALPEDVMRHVRRGSKAWEFARAGRHAAAERLLRDVAASLARRRATTAASQHLVLLGRLLLERGRVRDADTVFTEAASHAEGHEDGALVMDARLWQAAARTDAGQLAAAESICRSVLLTLRPPDDDAGRAEAALARVLLWQGKADEAAGLRMTSPRTADDICFAYVGATAVRVLLESGQVFEAGRRARDLLATVGASADPLVRLIAMSAHFRVLATTGDLLLAEQRLTELALAAREARASLRLARVRLLWAQTLRRAGRDGDARRETEYLQRLRPAVPPLLQRAIDRHLKGGTHPRPQVAVTSVGAAAVELITLGQHEEDDRAALTRLLAFAAARLRCSRADLCSSDAGPVTVMSSSGRGLATRLGGRVLEAGISIGPDPDDPSHELGVPVRLGTRLLAAIVVRWAADQTLPDGAGEFLAVMAAVAAPRVEALLSSSREASAAAATIPELIGESAAIAELRKAVARAAAAPFAVMIEGESGVGKELVARAIHHLGPRRQRKFCDVNCAALPDELIESELFGHARGAFTGAVTERAGLIEEADGGTLFLDEVADLSARAQAKLLRVIQQQEVRRVGESFSRKVDVRVVCAANRDMREESSAGRFRQDLMYRLDVIRIRIPPLRERPEDVARLASHFWRDASARVGTTAALTHGVLTALARYHWPGNVRELQNVMAALAVAAPSRGRVRPGLLPAAVTGAASISAARLADARAQFERRFLEIALARAGSRARAARELGMSRQGLLKLMTRLGMTAQSQRRDSASRPERSGPRTRPTTPREPGVRGRSS